MTTLKNGITIDESTWDSPNFWAGRPTGVIGATIHWWGLPEWNQKFNLVANYLSEKRYSNGVDVSTSAHYVVSDDRVACLVSPDNRAWHALSGNEQTVGLELDPNGGEATLENACQVIAFLEEYYGKSLYIFPHQYWTQTSCPGKYANRIDYIANRVNEIRAGKGKTQSAPARVTPTPTVQQSIPPKPKVQPKWIVEKGDTLSAIARYYKGEAKPEILEAIAKENGISVKSPLRIGQEIRIPAPLVWVVEKGDTWEKVANYYGFDTNYLKSLNPGVSLTEGNVLKVW